MAVILVVEDDPLIRELAEMTIQDFGHLTLSASDVPEAMSFIQTSEPIDVLFTVIHLKSAVFGGIELACQSVEIRPGLRVLYTTGNSISDSMRNLFVEGGGFLRKPYSLPQLETSIGALFAAKS